jgi:hypothetical protein
MLVAAQLLPAAAKFVRQVVPPVIATLIAAFLIAAYNTRFSSQLAQPRMGGGLQTEASATPATRPAAAAPVVAKSTEPATEIITIHEYADEPERLADKHAGQEAGKDQTSKLAAEAVPPRPAAPGHTATPAPRAEPRRFASVEHAQPMPAPVIAAPPVVVMAPAAPPVIAAPMTQEPPPVIVAVPPIATLPDRPNGRPAEARAEPTVPPQGPIGRIVSTLKPSNWFDRAREFGEKIEAAGNDILPNIRP